MRTHPFRPDAYTHLASPYSSPSHPWWHYPEERVVSMVVVVVVVVVVVAATAADTSIITHGSEGMARREGREARGG